MNKVLALALALTVASCATTDTQAQSKPVAPLSTPTTGEHPATPEEIAARNAPPGIAATPGDEPASVVDERRRAAEDPRMSCPGNDPKACHWVDVWRRHMTEQLQLPADWQASHIAIDFILMNDTPDRAMFTIQWTMTVDWLKFPVQQGVVVRSTQGAAFDGDDAVLARYADKNGGDGYHVSEMKPFTKLVAREKAVKAIASCHNASPGPQDVIELSEGKHLTMRGSAPPAKADPYHCIVATVDLETGKVTSCGDQVCRVD
jgi:hypothetical protein